MYFGVIANNLDLIFAGLKLTFAILVLAFGGGLLLGILVAALRMSPLRPVQWITSAYVEIFRNTPLLVQLFFIWLGLPLVGIKIDAFVSIVVALALNSGAYLSEIIRGGLQSVPRAQLEAASSLGLTPWMTLVDVVLPQAFRAVFPALVNQFIATLLGSAVGTVVGAPELTQQIFYLDSRVFRTVELLLFLCAVYAFLTFLITQLGRVIDRRLQWATR